MSENKNKAPRKVIGQVLSNKMDKTITVQVTRLEKHPHYGKYVKKHTRYYAHDEKNSALIGDKVEIAQTRPLSKKKRWTLVKVVATQGGEA